MGARASAARGAAGGRSDGAGAADGAAGPPGRRTTTGGTASPTMRRLARPRAKASTLRKRAATANTTATAPLLVYPGDAAGAEVPRLENYDDGADPFSALDGLGDAFSGLLDDALSTLDAGLDTPPSTPSTRPSTRSTAPSARWTPPWTPASATAGAAAMEAAGATAAVRSRRPPAANLGWVDANSCRPASPRRAARPPPPTWAGLTPIVVV